MTGRERTLAIGLGGVLAAGLLYQAARGQILQPLADRDDTIATLKARQEKARDALLLAKSAAFELENWKSQALPADASRSQTLYQEYLSRALSAAGFVKPTLAVARPAEVGGHYTRLSFAVRARCSPAQLVDLLAKLESAPVLHQLRKVAVKAVVEKDVLVGLDVNLTIDVLSFVDSDAKEGLPPIASTNPAKLAYDPKVFAERNLFQPTRFERRAPPAATPPPRSEPPRDDRPEIYITGTIAVNGVGEVWLTNRRTKEKIVVAEGSEFKVAGMTATVEKVNPLEILLRQENRLGAVRLGGNLASWRESTKEL